jgi:hypothetical protein
MQRSQWVPLCKPGTTQLLAKYDPARGLLEIQERRVKYYFDLTEYQPLEAPRAQEERQET